MKSFSKIVFLCNCCFLIMIILRYIELKNKKNNIDDNIIPLPFVTGTLVVLGELAVLINLIFCLVVLAMLLSKRMKPLPVWLVVFNFVLLLVQLSYFLFT